MTASAAAAVVIRPATEADVEAAARCQLDCWREAYADLAEPELLAVQLAAVDQRVASWRAQLAGGSSPLLAVAGSEVVGFASAGPAPMSEPEPPLMLYALYVRQARWGTGIGHRLITSALGEAAASLWVFRDNVRARTFYAGHGFRPTGEKRRQEHFGGVETRLVRPAIGQHQGADASAPGPATSLG